MNRHHSAQCLIKIVTPIACLALAGCSVVRGPEIKTVFAFPDETYAFDHAPISLDALRQTLGNPEQVQINIASCYRMGYRTVVQLMNSLRSAGYSQIAFATNPGRDLCELSNQPPPH